VYGNDELFDDVKQTLNDLHSYQHSRTSKQSSYLLTILTIYTVISGIYGMNQVIDDLEGNFDWSFLSGYSAFQWIAFSVTFTGLAIAFLLVLRVLWRWGRDFVRRQRR
jgi:Mg2+ and Co2+ transporter CorA